MFHTVDRYVIPVCWAVTNPLPCDFAGTARVVNFGSYYYPERSIAAMCVAFIGS